MIKTIDKHIFREWLKSFIVTLGVILAFLILQDMYNELIDLIRFGAGFGDIMRYYWVLIPSFLPVIIPLSFLVSLLYSLGKLHQNLEIIAMRASGMSLLKITRSLWLAAFALTGSLIYLNAYTIPKSIEQSRTIYESLQFTDQARSYSQDRIGSIPNLSFDNQVKNRLWFMNRFSEYTYQGYGITVHTKNDQGQETRRLMAKEGYFDDVEGHWVFLEGREVTFNPKDGEPIRSEAFERRLYTELTEHPNLMKSLKKDPQDLSFREINDLLSSIPVDQNPKLQAYAVQRQRTLASPFGCLVVAAIAIPFATSGVRQNPMIGVARASTVFALYYCIMSISGFLGSHLGLSSALAVWMPNVIMIGVAAYLHRRSI